LLIGGTLTQNSDERLKQDIEKIGTVLPDVLLLKPATYRFKNAGEETHRLYGFIAQEVRQVLPDIVHANGETGYLSLSYADFSVLAIRAIQEQQEIIEAQAGRIQALEELYTQQGLSLEKRLAAIAKSHPGSVELQTAVAGMIKASERTEELTNRLAALESLLAGAPLVSR
jgi:hypothetical protein